MTKTHLTMTGIFAGAPICGLSRPAHPGGNYVHAIYAPESMLTADDTCSECKAAWNRAASRDRSNG